MVPRKESKFKEVTYQKLGRFIAVLGSYRSKTLKTVNFYQKMALNGPNYAISEFSQHIEYDFLKENHQNNFHTKKLGRLIVTFGNYRSKIFKTVNFGKK